VSLEYQSVPAEVESDATVWWPDDLSMVEAIKAIAERRGRGKLLSLDTAVKEASMALVRRAPARAQLFIMGSPGGDLDPRYFRRR
jgi:hypothetical protein